MPRSVSARWNRAVCNPALDTRDWTPDAQYGVCALRLLLKTQDPEAMFQAMQSAYAAQTAPPSAPGGTPS